MSDDRNRGDLPEAGVGASGGGPPAEGYPPSPRTDQQITDAVSAAFFLDPDFAERQFRIEVVDGVVQVMGAVRSEEERRRALAIARDVEGVERVVDDLVVER
jgi:osmotically-inducible protein OsmY